MSSPNKNRPGTPRIDVKQEDARLNKPLDSDAPPTIYQSPLTPELASAALNLSIDFLKQQQGLVNKYLTMHPIVIFINLIFWVVYLGPRLNYLKSEPYTSVTSYIYDLAIANKMLFGSVLLFTAIINSLLITFLARFSEAFFKSKIEQITRSNGEQIFGFKLQDIQSQDAETLKNTNIVVYRSTPISLVSLSESKVLSQSGSGSASSSSSSSSNDGSLVAVINSLGCRRVYIRSGILEDLLDWCMIRMKQIAVLQKRSQSSMKLLFEVYSCDDVMKEILRKKGFKLVSVGKLYENKILGGLFGVKKELWGIQFHIERKKDK